MLNLKGTKVYSGVCEFSDLYGDSLLDYIDMPKGTYLNDISNHFSDTEKMEKVFKCGNAWFKAKRKFTFLGSKKSGKMFQIKTNYLHISFMGNNKESLNNNNFTQGWKENKFGGFDKK